MQVGALREPRPPCSWDPGSTNVRLLIGTLLRCWFGLAGIRPDALLRSRP